MSAITTERSLGVLYLRALAAEEPLQQLHDRPERKAMVEACLSEGTCQKVQCGDRLGAWHQCTFRNLRGPCPDIKPEKAGILSFVHLPPDNNTEPYRKQDAGSLLSMS